MIRPIVLVAILNAALLSGCGLISSDITDFDLSLPQKEFTVDTSQWGLSGDAQFPAIPCSADNDICGQAAASYCDANQCTGVCDTTTSTCKASVLVALNQQINLVSEKPELETIEDQPFIDVTIDAVEYRVDENTLNFDSPEITLYVAPLNVMNPESPEAQAIGVIPPIPAGRQLDWTAIQLTPAGEAALRQFMGDFRSIFNVIVGARVEIAAGDTMPSGRAVAHVRVDAHAGL